MYGQLNRMPAAACLEMGYPLHQWEWRDSRPPRELAKVCQMVEVTQWYQWQLGAVMMAPAEPYHPWWGLAVLKATGRLLSRDETQGGML